MKLWIPTLIAIAVLLPLANAGDIQSGSSTTCAESLALYSVDGVTTGLSVVSVQRGTAFAVSADTGIAYVDFYSPADTWIGWNEGNPNGVVPLAAAYGVMCVGQDPLGLGYPYAPDPTGVWTYQDGL